jgi:hypothetical protein
MVLNSLDAIFEDQIAVFDVFVWIVPSWRMNVRLLNVLCCSFVLFLLHAWLIFLELDQLKWTCIFKVVFYSQKRLS